MTRVTWAWILITAMAAAATMAAAQAPQGIAGVWAGTAGQGARAVPFELEISGSGAQARGALLNGPERSVASSGSFEAGHLVLRFDYYANTLEATVRDGVLTGVFGGHARAIAVRATRQPAKAGPGLPRESVPSIAGDWEIQVKSAKGESAWKLHVRQSGAQAVAAILRIDGDTGNLYGSYRDGQFTLSHFTAAGPAKLVLRPQPDGTLRMVRSAKQGDLIARRPRLARQDGLAGPDDPLRHTRWKDPHAPQTFRYPDLDGHLVSNADPRFRGKVVLVAIGGSWCPNCHDEAPFLEALYRKYHRRGLEIVELSFEEKAQLANPTRLRAFIQRYGITYPVLLAGEPAQLDAALPGAENLDCWPTTFFVGRDGLVKSIHAGYAGAASGQDHALLVKEVNHLIENMLAQ